MARENREFPAELASPTSFLDYKDPVSKARSGLKHNAALVINKDGEYYGIVDSRRLSGSASMRVSEKEKVGKFAVKVPRVSDETSVEDLAYYFHKLKVRALPYHSKGKIVGMVKRSTLLKMLLSLKSLDGLHVKDALTSPVLAIDSGTGLSHAISTMRNNNVNRLVVIDNGRFAGLITGHDIAKNYIANERLPEWKDRKYSPSNVPVSGVMEKNVRTIDYDSVLADAARSMVENHISSLVVTKGANPVGMVTISDLFEAVVARSRMESKRVLVSGFDEYTYQYEESVREELKSLMSQMEKMHNLDLEYVSLSLKRVKLKAYEMQARIGFAKGGTIRVHSQGNSFHDAFSDLMRRLKAKVIKEKESMISSRRSRSRGEAYVEYGE